jgi:hypothetical protein
MEDSALVPFRRLKANLWQKRVAKGKRQSVLKRIISVEHKRGTRWMNGMIFPHAVQS